MNRCASNNRFSNRRLAHALGRSLPICVALVAGCLFSISAPLAQAQSASGAGQREFPKAALRAVLEVTAPPQILLNGNPERLSPGARIKGVSNNLVMSGTLIGQRLLVNYMRDQQGLVHEVWLLNALEAQQDRPGLFSTNVTSRFDADKPKVDDGKTPFDQLPKFPAQ